MIKLIDNVALFDWKVKGMRQGAVGQETILGKVDFHI